MSIVGLIVVLAVVGFLLWLVNTYVPMDNKVKTIINVIILFALVLWLLQVFGVLSSVGSVGPVLR